MIELLAPAGDFDSLYAAVENGADAVYIGGKKYSARANANNFSIEEIEEVVSYCHKRLVKVYITVNILIHNNQIDSFVNYCDQLVSVGVDALILQDLGMAMLCKKRYLSTEIHLSTQLSIHNKETVELLKEYGFDRIVLARELNLETIAKLSEDIDTEFFVHGALCISYSGQCLISYLNGGRSGNKGNCAQCCRMKYKLFMNEKHIDDIDDYLLSPRDINLSENLEDLIKSGVSSLKLEGRMKRPEYVASHVSYYRALIDKYYGIENSINSYSKEDLEYMFNRKYNKAYLNDFDSRNLMNTYRPNHIGVEVGYIEKVTKNSVFIKVIKEFNQNDGLRILSKEKDQGILLSKMYLSGKLVPKANVGNLIEIKISNHKLKTKDVVVCTTNNNLIKKISNSNKKKVIKCDVNILIKDDEKFCFDINVGRHNIKFRYDVELDLSKNGNGNETIKDELSKVGFSCYSFDIKLKADNDYFVPKSKLKIIKRYIVEQIEREICENRFVIKADIEFRRLNLEITNDNILTMRKNKVIEAISESGNYHETENIVEQPKVFEGEKLRVSELGTLHLNNKKNIETTYHFNVTNIYSAYFLYLLGANKVSLSLELEKEELLSFSRLFKKKFCFDPNLEVFIKGFPLSMTMKYCVINHVLKDGTKINCNLCHVSKYRLENKDSTSYLVGDENCNIKLYESKEIDYLNFKEVFIENGITNFVEFKLED